MVQVLPVPALASSRTVPVGSSPVMSKGFRSFTALIRSLAVRPHASGRRQRLERRGLSLRSQRTDPLPAGQERFPDRPGVVGEPGDDKVVDRRANAEDTLVIGVGVLALDAELVVGVGLPLPLCG